MFMDRVQICWNHECGKGSMYACNKAKDIIKYVV